MMNYLQPADTINSLMADRGKKLKRKVQKLEYLESKRKFLKKYIN